MLLSDIVAFSARKAPDAPALHYGEATVTFAELQARIHRVASAVAARSAPGDRVAVLAENRLEYIDLYYGVPAAGRALAVLNYRLNIRELVKIIDDAGASVLFTEPEHLERVRAVRDELTSVRHVIVMGGSGPEPTFDEVVGAAPADPPTEAVDPGSMAWLIYTSGTTGMPKGAMLSHRSLLAAVCNTAIGWDSGAHEVALFPWPLCHVAGYSILGSHLKGNPVVLMRAYEPEAFLAHIERFGVTSTSLAPTMLNMLLDHPTFDRYDTSSVRRIGYGAAAMPAEVLRRAMGRFPHAGFGTGFGMTELSGNVFHLNADAHRRALEDDSEVLRSVGRQLPLSCVRIVDDAMRDVAVGEVGELVVRGDQVLLGYWNRPEATEEAFAGGWFHTGDLGRWDADGNAYIVDRKKDMIITGGENVYSREVEEVLYQHPAVVEAAVIGVPDLHWGENVVAVIQRRPGHVVSADEIVAHCRSQLAGYKKPKQVVFTDEPLPRNAAGKILKRDLREQVASGLLVPSP
ncbi:MAG: acyl-CoA synthetase [Acidimicrobiales bacterium]